MCAVVNKQTQGNVESLETLRRHISQLQADTSDGLKKNVYKHYHQFIETAKEISSASRILFIHATFVFRPLVIIWSVLVS